MSVSIRDGFPSDPMVSEYFDRQRHRAMSLPTVLRRPSALAQSTASTSRTEPNHGAHEQCIRPVTDRSIDYKCCICCDPTVNPCRCIRNVLDFNRNNTGPTLCQLCQLKTESTQTPLSVVEHKDESHVVHDWREECKRLTADMTEMRAELRHVLQNYEIRKEYVLELETENRVIRIAHKELEKQHAQLECAYDNFGVQYDIIERDFRRLAGQGELLQANYQLLQCDFDKLQTIHEKLQLDHGLMVQALECMLKDVVDKGTQTDIPTASGSGDSPIASGSAEPQQEFLKSGQGHDIEELSPAYVVITGLKNVPQPDGSSDVQNQTDNSSEAQN